MQKVVYGNNVLQEIKVGVDMVVDAVKLTAGPKGNNAIIDRGNGFTEITNDGVTVARSFVGNDDRISKMGVTFVQEACTDTERASADGTSATAILLQEMLNNIIKVRATVGDIMAFKKGMQLGAAALTMGIEEMSKPVTIEGEELKNVAIISTNNDKELGAKISEAFSIVGEKGVIGIEESGTADTEVVHVEGLKFDRGWMSPYFVNNSRNRTREMHQAHILITDGIVQNYKQIAPAIRFSEDHPLLLVVKDIEPLALQGLVLGANKGDLNLCIVKAPGVGDHRLDMVNDLCAAVGAKLVATNGGENFDFDDSFYGRATKITVGQDQTTIVGGTADEELVKDRIANITNRLDTEEDLDDYQKGLLNDRLAMLDNGVALIYLGAVSDTEYNEKKRRLDDAVGATRAALESGVVPGGGLALILAADSIMSMPDMTKDEKLGYDVVINSCKAPFKTILANAGLEHGEILHGIFERGEGSGFNVKTGEFVNMYEEGIIDPAKVVYSALKNATSVASMIATSSVIVCKPETMEV